MLTNGNQRRGPTCLNMDRKRKEQMRIAHQRQVLGEKGLIKFVAFNCDGLREGKWTQEEESYVDRLILDFNVGIHPLPTGMRLRTFLSTMLNCDPMRLSKKFVGNASIGKKQYRRSPQLNLLEGTEELRKRRAELYELERQFRVSVITQSMRDASNRRAEVYQSANDKWLMGGRRRSNSCPDFATMPFIDFFKEQHGEKRSKKRSRDTDAAELDTALFEEAEDDEDDEIHDKLSHSKAKRTRRGSRPDSVIEDRPDKKFCKCGASELIPNNGTGSGSRTSATRPPNCVCGEAGGSDDDPHQLHPGPEGTGTSGVPRESRSSKKGHQKVAPLRPINSCPPTGPSNMGGAPVSPHPSAQSPNEMMMQILLAQQQQQMLQAAMYQASGGAGMDMGAGMSQLLAGVGGRGAPGMGGWAGANGMTGLMPGVANNMAPFGLMGHAGAAAGAGVAGAGAGVGGLDKTTKGGDSTLSGASSPAPSFTAAGGAGASGGAQSNPTIPPSARGTKRRGRGASTAGTRRGEAGTKSAGGASGSVGSSSPTAPRGVNGSKSSREDGVKGAQSEAAGSGFPSANSAFSAKGGGAETGTVSARASKSSSSSGGGVVDQNSNSVLKGYVSAEPVDTGLGLEIIQLLGIDSSESASEMLSQTLPAEAMNV